MQPHPTRRPSAGLAAFVAAAVLLFSPAGPARAASPTTFVTVTLHNADGSATTVAAPVPAATPGGPVVTPAPAPGPVTRPTTPATPAADPTTRPTLGINLESLGDGNRGFLFADAMKTARRFGPATQPYNLGDAKAGFPNAAKTDAAGNAIGDAGTMLFTEGVNMGGRYRFSAIGRATLKTGGPARFENVVYDAASNTLRGELVVSPPSTTQPVDVSINWTNSGDGLKSVRVVRPGYTETDVFTREIIAAVKPFNPVRFMDYAATNNSPVRTWGDRAHVGDATYAIKGGPWEAAIDLCNATGKDCWLNVPAGADDDYARALGQLIAARLAPGRICYVEYSNETWNSMFSQFATVLAAARATPKTADPLLNPNGNDYEAAWRYTAKRIVQTGLLMGRRPGDNSRIRPVLASHVGYGPALLKSQLDYVARAYGRPADYLYAVAGAPYLDLGRLADGKTRWDTQAGLTIDQILTREIARASICPRGGNTQAFHDLALVNGLRSAGYELGRDRGQSGQSVAAHVGSMADVRAGVAVATYLDAWRSGGGGTCCWFALTSKYNKWGDWGLTDDARNLNTPSYRAAEQTAARWLAENGR